MRAVIIPRTGGADVLSAVRDFPEPVPADDEVVVHVAATSVNQMDLLVRNGYPGGAIPLPHVPGGDVAGTVLQVGAAVSSVAVGERVVVYPVLSCGHCSLCRAGKRNLCSSWGTLGIHHQGGYGERVAVPAENLVKLPDGVTFEQAATLPVAGLTAHHALATAGRLGKGEIAVVWGAGGGLGSMAVQVAKHLGGHVIAIVGTANHRSALERLGVDVIVDRTAESIVDRVREVAPEGADLVLDTIGSETFARSLAMLKNGGRLVSCGIIGGRDTTLNIHMVYFHHLSIHGVFLGAIEDMRAVVDLVSEGTLSPLIDSVLPLERAAEGQRMLEAGIQNGKIVLMIEE